jgi:hypothetical protein
VHIALLDIATGARTFAKIFDACNEDPERPISCQQDQKEIVILLGVVGRVCEEAGENKTRHPVGADYDHAVLVGVQKLLVKE